MDDLVRLEAVVRGRVQGVGFRYHVVREARRLGLAGWVANEHDGSVRTVAEGPMAALDRLEELLRTGPPGSVISGVSAVRMPATRGFSGFAVRAAGHPGD
jgi:acylphosphatase